MQPKSYMQKSLSLLSLSTGPAISRVLSPESMSPSASRLHLHSCSECGLLTGYCFIEPWDSLDKDYLTCWYQPRLQHSCHYIDKEHMSGIDASSNGRTTAPFNAGQGCYFEADTMLSGILNRVVSGQRLEGS